MSDEAADSNVEDIESLPEENDVVEDDDEAVESPEDQQEETAYSEDEEYYDELGYDNDPEIEESEYVRLLIEEMARQHSAYATYYGTHIQKVGIILAFATIGLLQLLFFIIDTDLQTYDSGELMCLTISIASFGVSCFIGLWILTNSRLTAPSPGANLYKIHAEANRTGRYLDAYNDIVDEEFNALDDVVKICNDLKMYSMIMAISLILSVYTLLVFAIWVII